MNKRKCRNSEKKTRLGVKNAPEKETYTLENATIVISLSFTYDAILCKKVI